MSDVHLGRYMMWKTWLRKILKMITRTVFIKLQYLPLEDMAFEKTLIPIIQKYFEHRDTNAVEEMLRDLNLGEMKSRVLVLAVSLALEGKASHRKMTFKLLSALCGAVISTNYVEKLFDKLLKDFSKLALGERRIRW